MFHLIRRSLQSPISNRICFSNRFVKSFKLQPKNIHTNNIKNVKYQNSKVIKLEIAVKFAQQSVSRPLSRGFHTTPTRHNPIISLFIRNVAKIASIFIGRAARNWWRNRTPEQRAQLRAFISRHKYKFMAPFVAAFLSGIIYYYSNIEETPITKRKRFVAFTRKQFEVISKMESEANIAMFKDKLLPTDNELTRRVGAVVKQLLHRNKDQPLIAENEWAVSVIKDDNNINAFVLPSGQIFVFTGLLKICDNDDQLGIVLAHEISHALLLHGIEMMSHAHIVDLIFIAIIGVLWMFLPTDALAIAMTAFSRLVLRIGLDAPYSRMLETEADEVGLQLAAKACLDIREASLFWEKMHIIEQEVSGIPQLDVDVEFLMTHPTHEHRAENLNAQMDSVMNIRECAGCKPLKEFNRAARLEADRKKITAMIKEKKYEGVLKIGEF